MSELVVLDHHHDAEAGVYRLTLGIPYETEKEQVDDEGNVVREHVPLLDGNGDPVQDVDGKEVVLNGPPLFTTAVEHAPGPEFVFADDADEYQGKSPEEIAAHQRAAVKKQMDERERDANRAAELAAKRQQLPGSGEAL